MKTFTIDMEMPVKALKEKFRETFGGTLRVYYGNKKAPEDVLLKSICTGGTANGDLEYLETMTVGEFCDALLKDYGLSVKIGSPDDWVIALDEYTLATVKDIPKNATKAKMQALLESQYADDDKCVEETMASYSFDQSSYQPSKASAIYGEYIINVKQNNAVEVFRIFDNVRGSLRECAEKVGFKYDYTWNTRRLGRALLRAYVGDQKQATIGNYTIVQQPSGSIETYRTYNDIMGTLEEIAAKIGFTIDASWDMATAGTKLVEYLNSKK